MVKERKIKRKERGKEGRKGRREEGREEGRKDFPFFFFFLSLMVRNWASVATL